MGLPRDWLLGQFGALLVLVLLLFLFLRLLHLPLKKRSPPPLEKVEALLKRLLCLVCWFLRSNLQ